MILALVSVVVVFNSLSVILSLVKKRIILHYWKKLFLIACHKNNCPKNSVNTNLVLPVNHWIPHSNNWISRWIRFPLSQSVSERLSLRRKSTGKFTGHVLRCVIMRLENFDVLITVFNNIWTLKLKAQSTNSFGTSVNNISGSIRQVQVPKDMASYLLLFVVEMMIDDSQIKTVSAGVTFWSWELDVKRI